PDPSERPFLPEGSFAPARGPEWLEEDSGNYLAELAAKLASHGGGESSADLALDLMLNKIVDQARLATAASGAAIALSRDGEMVCRASVGESAPGLGVRLNTRSGVSGACVQRKELQRCDDAENDPRVDAAACRDAEIRSILAVPILEGQELLGVLEVFASRTKAFDDTDVYAVQALSRRIVENLRRADDVGSSVDVASSVEEKSEEQRPYQEPVSPLAALSPVSEQTNTSSKKKAPNFGIMSAPPRWVGKKKESASSNASTSDTSQAKEEAEPPFAGGLRVYQNGRVIFRIGPSVEKPTQMPVELAAQTTTYEATPIESAAGAGPRTIPATVINSYLIKKVEPEYPEQAKQDHIQGLVELKALVGTDGTVKGIKVISGDPRLVDAVSKAVRGWWFKPYAPEGKPIEFETEI